MHSSLLTGLSFRETDVISLKRQTTTCAIHRVASRRFPDAKTVFNDPMLLTFPDDEHSTSEEREISIGRAANGRILLVVHTERGYEGNALVIRLISSRKATFTERRIYEEYET